MKLRDLTPQPISFADSAPVRITATTVADASPQAVWNVLADHRGWTDWFGPSLTRCEPTSAVEIGVGSTRVVGLRGGAEVHERFIAWDEGELWAFTGTAMGPAAFTSLVERVVLEELGEDRCRITYTMSFAPRTALRPAVALLRSVVKRSLQDGIESLARVATERSTSPD